MEDLDVEPDQCNQEPEGSVPLHVLWRASLGALFDEIEVKNEVESCDHDYAEAEQDSESLRHTEMAILVHSPDQSLSNSRVSEPKHDHFRDRAEELDA